MSKKYSRLTKRTLSLLVFMLIATPVLPALIGDFDGNNTVGFQDFFLFSDHFGTHTDSENWDGRFDLVSDGVIDFSDFFRFADHFGSRVNTRYTTQFLFSDLLNIYTTNAVDPSPVCLTCSIAIVPSEVNGFRWSPDGTQIAFVFIIPIEINNSPTSHKTFCFQSA